MSSIFELVNLEGTDSSRFSPIDDLRKAWTDNTMMGMEEVGANASAALQGSEIDFRELLRDAVQETQQGVSFGVDMVVTVGRKAAAQSSEGSWSMMNRALYAFCRETFVQGVDFGGMAKFFMRPR